MEYKGLCVPAQKCSHMFEAQNGETVPTNVIILTAT